MSAVVLEIYLLSNGLRLVDEGITLRLAFAKFDHLQDLLLLITFRKESDDLAHDGILGGNVVDQHFDDR